MRILTTRIFSVAGACAAAFGMLQCNAVLGIEEAQIDPTFQATATGGTAGTSTGGSSGTGTARPGRSSSTGGPHPGCIDRTADCSACLATCGTFDLARCMADAACRIALDDYRVCLAAGCDRDEVCREQVLFASSEPMVRELLSCLGSTCRDACFESPLSNMCELYCACMKDNCSTKPIGASADCVAQCRAGATSDGSVAHCRWWHCEFLSIDDGDPVQHCDHAIGMRGQCVDPQGPVPPCEGNRVIRGFPCLKDEDCCSRRCEGETCA